IVGQLAHWKGQDIFLDAAATLTDERSDVRFAVVGRCLFPQNEQRYVDGLHQQAATLGLADRLVWVEWADPIEPVMGALDVLVHASRLPEPFGRVIVEALAAGTPVVTSELGAGPELVTPQAGRIVPEGDPLALAAAVADVLADPDRRRGMSAAAKAA